LGLTAPGIPLPEAATPQQPAPPGTLPRRPVNEHQQRTAEVEAIETIGEVTSELVTVAEGLPVPAGRAEDIARILDRCSEDLKEAAAMIRIAARP
jgi:hypothetical protein